MFDKKTYARNWARDRRARKLAAANAGSRTCQHRQGPGRCGAKLEIFTDGMGRTVSRCPMCARRLQGICRDCPRPVYGMRGRAVRCAACARRASDLSTERYKEEHREQVLQRARERAASAPAETRQQRLERKRLWRMAHPDRVRELKKKAWHARDEDGRAKDLAYHRKYNASRRAAKALAAREQYRSEHPVPQPKCRECGRQIPWARVTGQGRPPHRCVFCMAHQQPSALRAAIKRWEKHEDIELVTGKPWTPKQPTRTNAAGERLCVTADCPTVVQFRAKKCVSCVERDRAIALEKTGGFPQRQRRAS